MKIAFLNNSQGLVERGSETFVSEIAKRLSEKHQVDIISGKKLPGPRWPIIWRAFIDPHGIEVLLFTLKNLSRLWRGGYDVIIPLNGGWQPALIRLMTWITSKKMVISGQSGKGWDDRNNLWCFPNAFVALSSNLEQWAKKVNPLIRTTYIPNGVDTHKFTHNGQKFDFQLEPPLILSVGALSNDKRMDLIIKAVSGLEKGSLLLVGKGSLKRELEELGRKLLPKRFKIVSFDFEKMPEVYRAADLFTLASPSYRSFEIVITEAMATNLPVVVNNDEIRREIVGEAGVLVDPVNTQEYSQAIANALEKNWDDKPRRQAEKFDWNKIALEYEKLFESLTK